MFGIGAIQKKITAGTYPVLNAALMAVTALLPYKYRYNT